MSKNWVIQPEWALLETGSEQERAGFAALGISAYGVWLTTVHDRPLQRVRNAPYLSAYHLAEWLAWNWWRLRWEPRKTSPEWELSHSMASIGSGYVWPNIHIISDGRNISLIGKPTPERERTAYRYINDGVSTITAAEFEHEVDLFIETVLQRLRDRQIPNSNLLNVWQAVKHERQDPASYAARKFEALFGEDPGEMDEKLLNQFLLRTDMTGEAALEEIAANHMSGQDLPDIASLLALGRAQGALADTRDRVSLGAYVPDEQSLAWKAGASAAKQLREQEHIAPETPITNRQLAAMYGTSTEIFGVQADAPFPINLSFSLSESGTCDRIMLRSKWESGRRFELARLLGDTLIQKTQDPLRPATRSDTYRQKAQRAFAAELLSPSQAVDAMLDQDYSLENQQDIAQHFQVSELAIRSLLVNNNRIDRSELE